MNTDRLVVFVFGIVVGSIVGMGIYQFKEASAEQEKKNKHQKEIVEELQDIETELGKIRREME